MRIGIVTDYYRPWPGGISEHVHHEAEELRKRGHQVLILTGPADGNWGRRPEESHVIRLGLELKFTENGAASRMVVGSYLLGFRRLLRGLQLDVLHAHAPLDPFLAPAAIAACEVASVGTFHSSFAPSFLWDTLFGRLRPISKHVFDRLDRRIAVSREAERCMSHYFPGEYEIIPNGVDVERFRPDLEPHSSLVEPDEPRPTILFVGRADPRKGLPILLEAFADVRRRVPGARLVAAGVERHEVGDAIAPELAQDIVFTGYVPAEDLPHYYAACDVFCSPAVGNESQGIVLLEAMASGRPPVAFEIPGYRDVVSHRRDGWLVGEPKAAPLADALCELLTDASLRAELGREGRKTAEGYAWEAIAERLEQQFLLAREEHGRRSRREPRAPGPSIASGG